MNSKIRKKFTAQSLFEATPWQHGTFDPIRVGLLARRGKISILFEQARWKIEKGG